MEEGFSTLLRILLAIIVAVIFLTAIYFLRDVLHEKFSLVKDIFSNMFKFS